jgi:hypothetical protein
MGANLMGFETEARSWQMPDSDPYVGWSLSDHLQMLAFRGRAGPPTPLAHFGALGMLELSQR